MRAGRHGRFAKHLTTREGKTFVEVICAGETIFACLVHCTSDADGAMLAFGAALMQLAGAPWEDVPSDAELAEMTETLAELVEAGEANRAQADPIIRPPERVEGFSIADLNAIEHGPLPMPLHNVPPLPFGDGLIDLEAPADD